MPQIKHSWFWVVPIWARASEASECSNGYNPKSTVLYLRHLSTVRNNLFLNSELAAMLVCRRIWRVYIEFIWRLRAFSSPFVLGIVSYGRTTIIHCYFIAIIFAGPLGRYLNTRHSGLVIKQFPRDPANVNAWKTMGDPYMETLFPLTSQPEVDTSAHWPCVYQVSTLKPLQLFRKMCKYFFINDKIVQPIKVCQAMLFRYSYRKRKMAELFANTGDPNRTLHFALHCLTINLFGVSRLRWLKWTAFIW